VESELESSLNAEGFSVSNLSVEDLTDFHMAVQTIHKRSEGLIKFVSDFRNLTHIQFPKKEDILLADLLRPILNLLKFDFKANKIEVELNIEPENLTLSADKQQIEQVLINLIKNAIHAMDENEEMNKSSKMTICGCLNEHERVLIKIQDNGSGIDEEAVKKIFIPFYTTKKSGSGIGLSLSKQIMRKHNGNLSVTSTLDEGSEFILSFPAEET
jgi:signal transduction histidine kinase